MQLSANSLVKVLTTAESIVSSALTNDEKLVILGELHDGLPPQQLCINGRGTRAIVENKLTEAIDGLRSKEATQKKPKQSRAGKAPTKKAKK